MGNKFNQKNNQKGVISIILSLLVLSILLIIGLGVSAVSLHRLKVAAQMGQSVTAYYAAEAGIEKCLYEVWQEGNSSCSSGSLSAVDASYEVEANLSEGWIESVGSYGITTRKIKTEW